MGSPELQSSLPKARPKVNPIELVIFTVVGAIFLQSVYALVHEAPTYRATALTPMAANPKSEGRSLAGISSPPLTTLDVTCEAPQIKQTDAVKARLSGEICPMAGDSSQVIKTIVTNSATHQPAVVFPDHKNHRYSTDYISLTQGSNPIQVKFTTAEGKSFTQDLTVIRQASQ